MNIKYRDYFIEINANNIGYIDYYSIKDLEKISIRIVYHNINTGENISDKINSLNNIDGLYKEIYKKSYSDLNENIFYITYENKDFLIHWRLLGDCYKTSTKIEHEFHSLKRNLRLDAIDKLLDIWV